MSFGVFQDFYSTFWLSTYSSSTISWIGSTQLFLELACAPVGGKLWAEPNWSGSAEWLTCRLKIWCRSLQASGSFRKLTVRVKVRLRSKNACEDAHWEDHHDHSSFFMLSLAHQQSFYQVSSLFVRLSYYCECQIWTTTIPGFPEPRRRHRHWSRTHIPSHIDCHSAALHY